MKTTKSDNSQEALFKSLKTDFNSFFELNAEEDPEGYAEHDTVDHHLIQHATTYRKLFTAMQNNGWDHQSLLLAVITAIKGIDKVDPYELERLIAQLG